MRAGITQLFCEHFILYFQFYTRVRGHRRSKNSATGDSNASRLWGKLHLCFCFRMNMMHQVLQKKMWEQVWYKTFSRSTPGLRVVFECNFHLIKHVTNLCLYLFTGLYVFIFYYLFFLLLWFHFNIPNATFSELLQPPTVSMHLCLCKDRHMCLRFLYICTIWKTGLGGTCSLLCSTTGC